MCPLLSHSFSYWLYIVSDTSTMWLSQQSAMQLHAPVHTHPEPSPQQTFGLWKTTIHPHDIGDIECKGRTYQNIAKIYFLFWNPVINHLHELHTKQQNRHHDLPENHPWRDFPAAVMIKHSIQHQSATSYTHLSNFWYQNRKTDIT